MRAPKIAIPEGCSWCGASKQSHGQRWSPVSGMHMWTAPSKGLIAARMRRNFQIKGKLPTDPFDPAHQGLLDNEA